MKEINLDTELSMMMEYGLTATEVKFIQYVIFAQDDTEFEMDDSGNLNGRLSESYRYLFEFMQLMRRNGESVLKLVESLKDKGIINKSTELKPGQAFRAEDIEFNKVKIKKYFRSPLDMFYELWNLYPEVLKLADGGTLPALGCVDLGAGISGPDSLAIIYGKKIKASAKKHAEVLKWVEWAKQHELIKCGLLKFVLNSEWEVLERVSKSKELTGQMRAANLRSI